MNEVEKRAGVPRWLRARPESWWWISGVVLVPVALVTGLAIAVLTSTTHPSDAATQIDLVKTALSVGAGTGGVVALVLAGRRQWHAEEAQRDTRDDAIARRITELYTKSADQLGADRAPVRLAGLYALERLAQDNPTQRQTIVNLLCAYLRMPYRPPFGNDKKLDVVRQDPIALKSTSRRLGLRQPNGTSGSAESSHDNQPARNPDEELQVRLTAQRILENNLGNPNLAHRQHDLWQDIDIDLTGATLVRFNLNAAVAKRATFSRARFVGPCMFESAMFEHAMFDDAVFEGDAWFAGAQIDSCWFSRAKFYDRTVFVGREIKSAAFNYVRFREHVTFQEAELHDFTIYGSTFSGLAEFDDCKFGNRTDFEACRFNNAKFAGAVFRGQTNLQRCLFSGSVNLADANFLTPPAMNDASCEERVRPWVLLPRGWEVLDPGGMDDGVCEFRWTGDGPQPQLD